jgi:hypothetical protein
LEGSVAYFDLDNIFDYHRPDEEQQQRMEWLRERFKRLAQEVVRRTASGPEQTLAVRKLAEAQQQAIAAIARETQKPSSAPASYQE